MGARAVGLINPAHLRPLVLLLLVLVAVYTYTQKNLGDVHAPKFIAKHERLLAVIAGAVIGFYDGFFGPGTGSFLMFMFIGLLGFDFLTASASAKLINVATNVAAFIAFAWSGNVLYEFAIPMGLCNVLGAVVGTRLAVLKGNRFVRGVFLVVVIGMIARVGYGYFKG